MRDRIGPATLASPIAEADELIAAQYCDRPQLRLVLDAELAGLPAPGPMTVQARKTLISVSTPRCVFAVIQPTTKTRPRRRHRELDGP
jgi:hypothetical protein